MLSVERVILLLKSETWVHVSILNETQDLGVKIIGIDQ